MKTPHAFAHCVLLAAGVQAFAVFAEPKPVSQFTSRVYFLIHETTPSQLVRSRKRIEREFARTVDSIPQLQSSHYQIISDGNEVVFSMVSSHDMQQPFQAAVSEMVGSLNGQVRTRGRYDFLRTSMDSASENYLEVVLDETSTRIRTVVARSVPLRDLLGELKMQFADPSEGPRNKAPRFSYLIPGECAARQVDWSFGTPQSEPKSLDEAMKELAKLFKLGVENHQGTYIFSGECPRSVHARKPASRSLEFLPNGWIPLEEGSLTAPLTGRRLPIVPVHISE